MQIYSLDLSIKLYIFGFFKFTVDTNFSIIDEIEELCTMCRII